MQGFIKCTFQDKRIVITSEKAMANFPFENCTSKISYKNSEKKKCSILEQIIQNLTTNPFAKSVKVASAGFDDIH